MADTPNRKKQVDRLASHWSKHMAEIDAHVTNVAAAKGSLHETARQQAASQKGSK